MDILAIIQEDGPAVFADQPHGVIITASLIDDGCFLNWWHRHSDGTYALMASQRTLVNVVSLPLHQVRHVAAVWFRERMRTDAGAAPRDPTA